MWISPSEIRFTHDSISPFFSCGRGIVDTYEDLKRDFIDVSDIPRMTVTLMDDEWYTYKGNRRLWVFQKLERKGYIHEIFVERTDRMVPSSRFTTRNEGLSVRVREGGGGGARGCDEQPRNVACPVCGSVRFKSGVGAVMHVESGACAGCPGAANARGQILRFVQGHRETRSMLTPMLMDRQGREVDDADDRPYQCRRCERTFRQVSQLMQHTRDKHGEEPQHLSLGYY